MNYNEALQNADFKKIWEAVKKDRPPESLDKDITFEDILILLDGKITYSGIQENYHIFGSEFQYTNETDTYIDEVFKLKIYTEFYEQDPKTWKIIAEIMSY